MKFSRKTNLYYLNNFILIKGMFFCSGSEDDNKKNKEVISFLREESIKYIKKQKIC